MEEQFKTAESVQKWLSEDRNVPSSVAVAVAATLFDGDYVFPSSLLNIPRPDLESLDISPPHRNILFNKLQQQEQQQLQNARDEQARSDAALHKLLPFIDVLPSLLREVNLTRKARLNPWERESARTTGSKRSDKFREKVISYYKRASQSKQSVKCQVLDMPTPIEEARDKIIAAHIWKASTRGKGLDEFGLEENDVNSPRNGLFLTKGIEDAFDKQQVCFLYNFLQDKLFLWVADSNIKDKTIKGSTMKFSDVHQRPLVCPRMCLPYRRLLSWHARLTLGLRKESIQVDNLKSEYDNSPGRSASKDDPIACAINNMVEPGDDASVEKE